MFLYVEGEAVSREDLGRESYTEAYSHFCDRLRGGGYPLLCTIKFNVIYQRKIDLWELSFPGVHVFMTGLL